MAITEITRDWGDNPSIVRIITTDSLTTVSATGYITAQAANIALVNQGPFTWLQTDQVLVNAGGTVDQEGNVDGGVNSFFQISADFTSLFKPGAATAVGLTAHAGGGQTNGTPLISGFNTFTTVATAADSATLPANVLGQTVTVTNTTVTSMTVYPSSGDTINALSANTGLAVAGGATTVFYGNTATGWVTK